MPWLGCARVDRHIVATITGCTAVGFPAFTKDRDNYRRSVQLHGSIPTVEGASAGYLRLKVTGPELRDRPPLTVDDLTGTPWAGMTGAVVSRSWIKYWE